MTTAGSHALVALLLVWPARPSTRMLQLVIHPSNTYIVELCYHNSTLELRWFCGGQRTSTRS